jgi:hypothetical protein
LRGAEGTGVKAISTTDAKVFVVQHDTVVGGVKTVHRTYCSTGRIRAVHAGHRNGLLTPLTVFEGHHPTPVDSPGNVMLVVARRDTGIAFDTSLHIT